MHGAYLSTGMLNFDSARSADMAADFPWAWNSWVDASKKVFQSSLPALAFSSDGASVQILNHVCVLEGKLLPDELHTFIIRMYVVNTSCGTINSNK